MDEEVGNREEEERGPSAKLEAGERGRKRRRPTTHLQPSRWKTLGEHQSYSSKLLEALRHAGGTSKSPSPTSAHAPLRSRVVRDAADRVLAVAARGRTRWSRAILSNSCGLRLRRKRRIVPPRSSRRANRGSPSLLGASATAKKAPSMERKVKVLARLVPGCRKLPFPSLLEEASDYIAALEMQIRAMNALAKVLSSVSSSGAGSSTSVPTTTATSSSPQPEA